MYFKLLIFLFLTLKILYCFLRKHFNRSPPTKPDIVTSLNGGGAIVGPHQSEEWQDKKFSRRRNPCYATGTRNKFPTSTKTILMAHLGPIPDLHSKYQLFSSIWREVLRGMNSKNQETRRGATRRCKCATKLECRMVLLVSPLSFVIGLQTLIAWFSLII